MNFINYRIEEIISEVFCFLIRKSIEKIVHEIVSEIPHDVALKIAPNIVHKIVPKIDFVQRNYQNFINTSSKFRKF